MFSKPINAMFARIWKEIKEIKRKVQISSISSIFTFGLVV